jgi:hypothetical protein
VKRRPKRGEKKPKARVKKTRRKNHLLHHHPTETNHLGKSSPKPFNPNSKLPKNGMSPRKL